MDMPQEFRSGRHCVFVMHVHLVFTTKYRRKVFDGKHLHTLAGIFKKVCDDFDCEIAEFDGEKDHVHLLINYPPKVAISKLVNSLKGVSSRRMRQHHPDLEKHYWKNVLWSRSYFASSCGGAPIEILRQYIEQQQTPK